MTLCTHREPKPRRWEGEYADTCDARGTHAVYVDGAYTMRCDRHAPRGHGARINLARVVLAAAGLAAILGYGWILFTLWEG